MEKKLVLLILLLLGLYLVMDAFTGDKKLIDRFVLKMFPGLKGITTTMEHNIFPEPKDKENKIKEKTGWG